MIPNKHFIIILSLFFYFVFGINLEATTSPLYEKLLKESPEAFSNSHLLQEVNLLTGQLSLQRCDGLLLGASPVSLLRSTEKASEQDLFLADGWVLQVNPQWVVQKSEKSTSITIPTPTGPARHHLLLTQKSLSNTQSVLQLSSQNRSICRYTLSKEPSDKYFILKEVQKLGEDAIFYTYTPHPLTNRPLLTSVKKGDVLESHYVYDSQGRLSEIWHPAHENQNLTRFLKCHYQTTIDGGVVVDSEDAEGAKRVYHFSKDKQLTLIETFLDHQILRTETFKWKNTLLLEYTVCDAKNALLGKRAFAYDSQGNCTKSTLTGNLTGHLAQDNETLTTLYSYDEEGRVTKTEKGHTQQHVHYLEKTSLPTAEYQLTHDKILHRTFTHYDSEGNLLRLVEDDGTKLDESDLTDVKKRVIMTQSVRMGQVGKGLPYCIDALHLDLESGEEIIDHSFVCLHDENGQLIQKQEFTGKGELLSAIAYAYDELGRLVVEDHLEGPSYTYLHSPLSLKILCCQKNGSSSSTYSYDAAGHLIREESCLAKSSLTQNLYSPLGNCLKQEDSLGNATTFYYDALGRKTKEERPAILAVDDKPQIPTQEWLYDALDRPLEYVDADGFTTQISCTLYGHPYLKKYPDGTVEELHYTREGMLQQTRDRTGKIQQAPANTSFTKECSSKTSTPPTALAKEIQREKTENALGQNVFKQQRMRDKLIETSTYDALNQLVSIEERDLLGKRTRLQKNYYDCSGRTVLQQWFHEEANMPPYEIARSYGPMGRLEKIIEGAHTDCPRQTTYHYDHAGRLSAITQANGCQIIYTYDEQGRLSTLKSSDQSVGYLYHYDQASNPIAIDNLIDKTTLTRCYDEEGRLLEEKLPSGHQFTYQYDQEGRLLILTYPDKSRALYTYDEKGVQSVTRQTSTQKTLYTQQMLRDENGALETICLPYELGEVAYERDACGKRCKVSSPFFEHTLFCAEASSQITAEKRQDPEGIYQTSYRHDAWQQLIEEQTEGQNAPESKTYAYDALGNRVQTNDQQADFHANNALKSAQKTTYTYDINGNRIRSDSSAGTLLYSYDALSRLISVEQPSKARTTYSYDPFHRRNSRTSWIWDANQKTWQMQHQETFLYQDALEVGAIHSDGKSTLRVLLPNTLAESDATIAIEQDAHLYIPLQDLHGSTSVLVDAKTRQAVEYYRRDAFGQETIYQTDSHEELNAHKALNPWRVEGKRHDPETGFIYYGQRFYDPSIGMWLTKDPLGFCDGPQDSLFVRNNPLHRTDRHGLFSVSKLWNTFFEYSCSAAHTMHHAADNVLQFFLHDYNMMNTLKRDLVFFRGMCARLISAPILEACDFYTTQPASGVYGNRELSDHIRFSYVNGIMNSEKGVFKTLKQLSSLHDGVNIHYTYRPTEGWTLDILKAVLVLRGYTSPTATSLAGMWRQLIEDMGGEEGPGIIIHYAHSLGSAETNSAQSLLTSAEKRKLRIFTFGSPVLIQNSGFAGVTNYVSRLDTVPLFDPYTYFSALFGKNESNVVFIGSYWGLPLLDHYIDHKNYMTVLRGLGRFFSQGVYQTPIE